MSRLLRNTAVTNDVDELDAAISTAPWRCSARRRREGHAWSRFPDSAGTTTRRNARLGRTANRPLQGDLRGKHLRRCAALEAIPGRRAGAFNRRTPRLNRNRHMIQSSRYGPARSGREGGGGGWVDCASEGSRKQLDVEEQVLRSSSPVSLESGRASNGVKVFRLFGRHGPGANRSLADSLLTNGQKVRGGFRIGG